MQQAANSSASQAEQRKNDEIANRLKKQCKEKREREAEGGALEWQHKLHPFAQKELDDWIRQHEAASKEQQQVGREVGSSEQQQAAR